MESLNVKKIILIYKRYFDSVIFDWNYFLKLLKHNATFVMKIILTGRWLRGEVVIIILQDNHTLHWKFLKQK